LSLKQNIISGVKWTTASTVIVLILQLLQLSILARFLEPRDFGLMALVMVIIGFSQAFMDMGISNAIIYKLDNTREQLSTLYWVNVLAGCVIFIVLVGLSPLIAKYYNEPKLIKLIVLVAFTFIVQPFGQQFMILWQKEMRFDDIAKIDIVTKTVSLLVSSVLAINGYGVYALVYSRIFAVVCQTALFMFKGLKEYRPLFIFKINIVYEYLNFGLYQMGDKTINYINSQLDTIIIGKLLGFEALGIYNIAKQLILRPAQLINPIITKVAFPAMSKIQDDSLRLKNIYLKSINYLSSVSFPIYTFMFIMAPAIVTIMFGDSWMDAVPIVRILSIYGAIRATGNPIGSLLLAKGKASWGFWWNLGLMFYIPIGIIISSQWGLVGVAWGLVILTAGGVIPSWYFLVKKLCYAGFVEYHKEIAIPMLIAIVTGIFVYPIVGYFGSIVVQMILAIIMGLAALLLLNIIFNRRFILEIMENLR
jgi:O-antigen/teichoic acid export membrane protein